MKAPLVLAAVLALGACAKPQTAETKVAGCAAREGGALKVANAWVRAQADASGMSAAYFTLCNAAMTPATIEGLSTPAAGLVELHETTRDSNGVVSMAPTGPITLAPGEAVVFEPGGKHAMLMSLAEPIAEGATVSLTLELADGSTIETAAEAKSVADAAAHHH